MERLIEAGHAQPIGLARLIQKLPLAVPLPAVPSQWVAGSRRQRIIDGVYFEQYPSAYAPKNVIGHVKFIRVMNVVDMPDRRASLLVRLILQNKGRLAKRQARPVFGVD